MRPYGFRRWRVGAANTFRHLVRLGVRVTPRASGTLRTTVKQGLRLVASASGVAARTAADVGIRVTTRITHTSVVRAGLRIAADLAATLTHTARCAVRVTPRASGAPAKPNTKPGLRVAANRLAARGVPQKPAVNITRIRYDLTHRRGGNAVTEEAVNGRTDWVNDANAISGALGKNDGSSATISGDLVESRSGRLRIDYPDLANKTPLTITSVKLFFYVAHSGSAGAVTIQWKLSSDAGWTNIDTLAGVNHLTSPYEADLTAARAWTWSDLDALQAGVQGLLSPPASGSSGTCDAVELEIVAEATDTP